MVQLALKVLLLISLGQYFVMGGERNGQRRHWWPPHGGGSWWYSWLPATDCWCSPHRRWPPRRQPLPPRLTTMRPIISGTTLSGPNFPPNMLPKFPKDQETFYQPRQLSPSDKRRIVNEFDANIEQEARRIFGDKY